MMKNDRHLPIRFLMIVMLITFSTCNGEKSQEPAPVVPAVEQPAQEKPKQTDPNNTLSTAEMPPLLQPKNPDEACGQVIVIAWKDAAFADDKIVRDKQAANVRAKELLKKTQKDPDFARLAKQNSDAGSSGPRGGIMGTYTREKWPKIHLPIRDVVFQLKVNQIADELVEAPYGYVIVRRCLVERVPARHILVRYKGAERVSDEVVRSRENAKKLAEEIYAKVATPGADFGEIAKKHSEDSSAKRGGDIGKPARGQLAVAFEEALFNMGPGEIRGVVETEFGFHIIQRLKEDQ